MMSSDSTTRPLGVKWLVGFFSIAAFICAASALSLALPGTGFDAIWRIKPAAHDQFVAIGTSAILLLAAVLLLMGAAASGLWLGRRWG